MTTNLQIAQELWKEVIRINDDYGVMNLQKCNQHLSDCQRFLNFLENDLYQRFDLSSHAEDKIKNKIQDLQATIKFYQEKGIK